MTEHGVLWPINTDALKKPNTIAVTMGVTYAFCSALEDCGHECTYTAIPMLDDDTKDMVSEGTRYSTWSISNQSTQKFWWPHHIQPEHSAVVDLDNTSANYEYAIMRLHGYTLLSLDNILHMLLLPTHEQQPD